MATFRVTLKRVVYATVTVEATTAADVRLQLQDEDERWQAFNGMADGFYGEETKLVRVERQKETA